MLIDSHCHLERFARRGILDDVLKNATDAGVDRLITVGTSTEDWDLYRDLAATHPKFIHYTVGLHPCHVKEGWQLELEDLINRLRRADDHPPVAIGEMGLDYFHLPRETESRMAMVAMQKAAFEAQLAIAADSDLPIIIHSRDAFNDCVRLIDASGINWDRVVFHCFSEGSASVDRINLRGGRASFTGTITYSREKVAQVHAALIEQGPERLMLETDSPYLTPTPKKGEENQPAFLGYILQHASALFEMQVQDLEDTVYQSTMDFFRLAQ